MVAMFSNDDSVLLCITHFYVDLVCFSIKKRENVLLVSVCNLFKGRHTES